MRKEILKKLRIKNCNKCALSKVRRKNSYPVWGKGSVPADILFLGEAPGETEELLGEPFVGRSGQLLQKMLNESIGKNVSYFITNSVMCRPTDKVQGKNRKPKPCEVIACSQNVMDIYDIVKPKIVIFVGKVVEENYKKEFPNSIFIYHPAYLLRGGGTKHSRYLSEIRKLSELSEGFVNEKD